jgi:hypothetical protein
VLTWISSGSGSSNNPFSTLDILYSKIVTSAKAAYEAALDHADSDEAENFLLLLRAYQLSPLYNPVFGVIPVQDWDMLLCGELNAHELVLSDLRSLMTTVEVKKLSEFGHHIPAPGFRPLALHIYHKSFVDFCGDEARSKDLYIPHSRVIEYYAHCTIQHMSLCPLRDGTFDLISLLVFARIHPSTKCAISTSSLGNLGAPATLKASTFALAFYPPSVSPSLSVLRSNYS